MDSQAERCAGRPQVSDGELRQAQVLTTYGPGSMVDLPDHSVIIGGLDFWRWPGGRRLRIREDRLEARLRQMLKDYQLPELPLYAPPAGEEIGGPPSRSGIESMLFPLWF